MLVVAAFLSILLFVPHLLSRTSVAPVAGIGLWLSVLALRGALSVVAVFACLLYQPATAPFELISGWCSHTGLPLFATNLGMSGHMLGDVASFVPAVALAALTVTACFGTWRAVHRAASWLRRNAVGRGPSESVIVGEREMIVATAGISRPRVIVSAGALLNLDDDELAAGLQHEWGHVRRGHRFVTLTSAGLLACSRLLPGGQRAFRNLQFHLERDADRYAIRRTGNPMALASAICKVASRGGRSVAEPVAFASLAGADVTERVRLLVAEMSPSMGRQGSFVCVALSLIIGLAALGLLIAMPDLMQASAAQAHVSTGQSSGCLC